MYSAKLRIPGYCTAQISGDFASTVIYHGHKSKNAFSYELVARLVVPILKHTKKCRLFRIFPGTQGSVGLKILGVN